MSGCDRTPAPNVGNMPSPCSLLPTLMQRLLDMLYGDAHSCGVPPRGVTLLQTTHLQPKLLCDWMQRTAAAALVHMQATGGRVGQVVAAVQRGWCFSVSRIA